MILFKSCPRCGGDVDATYRDDVYCIQCAHRPLVVFPGPQVVKRPWDNAAPVGAGDGPASPRREVAEEASGVASVALCPRCGSERLVRLDLLRPLDNACYRCGLCGHIFSPVVDAAEAGGDATPA